jgi:hypothetical protein
MKREANTKNNIRDVEMKKKTETGKPYNEKNINNAKVKKLERNKFETGREGRMKRKQK